MLVYILTGLVAFLSLRNYENIKVDKLSKENKWLKAFYKNIAILILTLVCGLRDYSVGTDTRTYLLMFNYLGTEFNWSGMLYEKGYCFVSILSNKLFGHFTAFLIISSFILYWNIVTSFCELSELPSVSILCYFGLGAFAQGCNALRQYLALSFCMIALFYFIKKKRILPFLLFVFIGCMFHKSALVFLIVIPLKYIRFNIATVTLFLVLIIALIPLTPFIVGIADNVLGSGYAGYLSLKSNPFNFINLGTIAVMFVCIYLLIIFRRKVEKETDKIKEYEFYANMFLLFVGIFVISIFTAELIDRIAIYFMPSIFFIIPIALKTFKNYMSNFFINMLAIVLIVVSTYLLMIRGSYGVMPYTFI